MASSAALSTLLVVLFFLCSRFSSCATTNPMNSPRLTAERLIRSLNLSPREAVNIDHRDSMGPASAPSGPRLVEWSFTFPGLRVHESPNLDSGEATLQNLGHHAGYFRLPHTHSARMFYFFFESRVSKDDPVVIWLTGGPGCSGALALFYENGPFHISSNLSLSWNDYGWDKVSNIIFVDQPTGTGFSYSSDPSDLRHNEAGVSNDLYDFLQAFFNKHPELVKNDFFITGESYAGHYIPALATRINKGNKAKEGIHINLKGIAIGNGLTNPEIQYAAYADYALSMKLIGQSDYDDINSQAPSCKQEAQDCQTSEAACDEAYEECQNIFSSILNAADGDLNYYDIRKKCEGSLCYDFSALETFLNEKSVREALGVGDIEFVSCSSKVHISMISDLMKNLAVGIPALLEDGIRVLIYAGEYDLICNWLGNSKWVHAMQWSGRKNFVAASTVPFVVDRAEAGLLKSHGPLSFMKVRNAGHMVPMDQPKASLQMLQSWMKGRVSIAVSKSVTSPL
ncbi:serine carboxypeptidase-like [Punica granatum]|uniref:Carboxypeptidase n=1 Tax=Punica granatum TaxID=22663 RepID=A0A218W9N0_PUNGR|nr:serine carboxypeptidase-like [Punica granatum]OWM68921.1 hypothetical protein CDL15_Pgr025108 [Punica granatum]